MYAHFILPIFQSMLSQIVRPMVNTQVRLLAKSKEIKTTLIRTIAKWLGFLGVEAKVTEINGVGNKIQVSIIVGQPDNTNNSDWQKILDNLNRDSTETSSIDSDYANDYSISIPQDQQTKYQRIVAYALQMSNSDPNSDWSQISPQLQQLGLDKSMMLGVKSALRVPQSIDRLVKDLDADVAVMALSQTASIALSDRKINSGEYQALQTLLDAVANNCR